MGDLRAAHASFRAGQRRLAGGLLEPVKGKVKKKRSPMMSGRRTGTPVPRPTTEGCKGHQTPCAPGLSMATAPRRRRRLERSDESAHAEAMAIDVAVAIGSAAARRYPWPPAVTVAPGRGHRTCGRVRPGSSPAQLRSSDPRRVPRAPRPGDNVRHEPAESPGGGLSAAPAATRGLRRRPWPPRRGHRLRGGCRAPPSRGQRPSRAGGVPGRGLSAAARRYPCPPAATLSAYFAVTRSLMMRP
jgi:hypothetical protein